MLEPVPFVTDIWRGETIALTARTGISNIATTAEFLWQTNGMSSSWWRTNATVTASGDVTALWTPAMDPGASVYSFFFKAGGIYRPFGTIKMQGSPGTYPGMRSLFLSARSTSPPSLCSILPGRRLPMSRRQQTEYRLRISPLI